MSVSEPEENGETEYGLLVPFVAAASHGGPYDDQAYAAGFEIGKIWNSLEKLRPRVLEMTIRSQNVEQADLVAMHFNYTMSARNEGDGWTTVRLSKAGGF